MTCLLNSLFGSLFAEKTMAPPPWKKPQAPKSIIKKGVFYPPLAHGALAKIPIQDNGEPMVSLLELENPRLLRMNQIDPSHQHTCPKHHFVRQGVKDALLRMLDTLPNDIGIAYDEGFRPLGLQKQYFDAKFKEFLKPLAGKPNAAQNAYKKACLFVSPFIDNTPTHCTGAAIDMRLFQVSTGQYLDMGFFDCIYGHQEGFETFSPHTTPIQRENRLIMLDAATKAGLVNYGFEWWHYSYGDRAWAYVHKKPYALYDLAMNQDPAPYEITKEQYLKVMADQADH